MNKEITSADTEVIGKPQYMFLTMNKEGEKGPQVHRVGVIAIRKGKEGVVSIAGTIVSKSEPFVAKKGVAKAIGRLNGQQNDKNHVFHMYTEDEIHNLDIQSVCRFLGLESKDNYYKHIDWKTASKKFRETFGPRSNVRSVLHNS